MGNDSSHLSGLEVNEKAIEITDFWAHYHATVNDTGYFFNVKGYGSISVFKSETAVLGNLWINYTPLEKCAINLMKNRHPWILRYVWHWQQRGVQYLATEPVQPLSQALSLQDPLQICTGLNQIAHALDFLHSKASLSHNNVSVGSIFVLPDGCWKLGAMEFAKPFSEITPGYLKQSKKHRYDKAVDPNEETSDDYTTVDQFAFCTLVEDVFKGRNSDDIPHWKDFKKYCHQDLQNPIASQRPKFSSILKHDFFNHEFISVHKFLTALPVKSETEKASFFNSLLEKLRGFNEELVAKQLGGPLLSRLVLLDNTAREKLLPHMLVPKLGGGDADDCGLFSLSVFKTFVTPHLLKMFQVRDVQVRLLLLKHFSGYLSTFNIDDLTTHVLPELLLGIKDTSDHLVSMTLFCLADLVPVLGASTVIGGKRKKLFVDGRPLLHTKSRTESIKHKSKQKHSNIVADSEASLLLANTFVTNTKNGKVETIAREEMSFGNAESPEIENVLFLHERPSPDGGEDLDSEGLQNIAGDNLEEEHWSDWDTEENQIENPLVNNDNELTNDVETTFDKTNNSFDPSDKTVLVESPLKLLNDNNLSKISTRSDSFYLQKASLEAKTKKLADISELDIKSQKFKSSKSTDKDEFNFFSDMEPVIEKTSVFNIEDRLKKNNDKVSVDLLDTNAIQNISSKLSFAPIDAEDTKTDNDAWGDADWDD